MEISFFADKKSENFCAGSITEQQTRKVTETQKKHFARFLLSRALFQTHETRFWSERGPGKNLNHKLRGERGEKTQKWPQWLKAEQEKKLLIWIITAMRSLLRGNIVCHLEAALLFRLKHNIFSSLCLIDFFTPSLLQQPAPYPPIPQKERGRERNDDDNDYAKEGEFSFHLS